MTRTREQMIDELPDELLKAAKKELEYQEWFIALKTNAQEDDAIFDLALEMQEQQQREAMAAETIAMLEREGKRIAAEVSAEYSARFKTEANQIIANLEARLREIDERAAVRAQHLVQVELVKAVA